jgi:hypothetical protein
MATEPNDAVPFLRRFSDSRGRAWEVWDVVAMPERSPALRLRTEHGPPLEHSNAPVPWDAHAIPHAPLIGGWLVFDCGDARRRLSPIPPLWRVAPTVELERMCAAARPSRIDS